MKRALIIIFLLQLFMSNILASEIISISCNTLHDEESFVLKGDQITLKNKIRRRVRINKIEDGQSLNFRNNGVEYEITITNLKNFSELDDYLTLTNIDNRTMTYPLICK